MIPLNRINCLHGKLFKSIYKALIKFWKETQNVLKNALIYLLIY